MNLFIHFFVLTISLNGSCKMVNGQPQFENGYVEDADAWADWSDSLDQVGWYKLHVKGNKVKESANILFCAGFLEGYFSHDRIYQHFLLVFDENGWNRTHQYPKEIKKFIQDNMDYTMHSVEAYQDSKYWQEIGLIMKQFNGLVAGYEAADKGMLSMDRFDHWFVQSQGDMDDISEVFPNAEQPKTEKVGPGAHCSGLIRILPDYSDLYMSHDTWSDYRELHGELKEYDLPIKEFKSNRLTLSTRIGLLSSIDDFYITDKGLFIIETTLSSFNEDLYDRIVPQALFTWIRALHASWCSESGKEWTDTFIQHNSGTYNNQYLVVDSKKLEIGKKPESDLLWIIEQLPGTYRSADITSVLLQDGYFPSINTPYFDDLFILAHYPEKIASWGSDGNYWDMKTSSRYLLMQREAPVIMDFEQFKLFMRYADWQRDLFSNGDPGQMILSRYDQRKGYLPHFPKKMFGGLDTKALKLTEAVTRMHFHALGSPEYIYNPPFKFSDWPDIKHDGLKDGEWIYNWTTFQSNQSDICSSLITHETCINNQYCGWCTYDQKCYPGNKQAPYFNIQCESGWEVKQVLQSWAVPVVITVSSIIVVFVSVIYLIHFTSQKD